MTTLSSFCRFLLNSTTLSNPTKSTGFSVTNFPSVEGIVFGVCRVDGDLGLLDVTEEGSIGLAYAEGDGELTPGVGRMYSEGSIG